MPIAAMSLLWERTNDLRVSRSSLVEMEWRSGCLHKWYADMGWGDPAIERNQYTGVREHSKLPLDGDRHYREPDHLLLERRRVRFVVEAKVGDLDLIQLGSSYALSMSPHNQEFPTATKLFGIQATDEQLLVFSDTLTPNVIDRTPSFEFEPNRPVGTLEAAALQNMMPGVDPSGERLHVLALAAMYRKALATHAVDFGSPLADNILTTFVHGRRCGINPEALLLARAASGPITAGYIASPQDPPPLGMVPVRIWDSCFGKVYNPQGSWINTTRYAMNSVMASPVNRDRLYKNYKMTKGAVDLFRPIDREEYLFGEPPEGTPNTMGTSGRYGDEANGRFVDYPVRPGEFLRLNEIYSGPGCFKKAGLIYQAAGLPPQGLLVEYRNPSVRVQSPVATPQPHRAS